MFWKRALSLAFALILFAMATLSIGQASEKPEKFSNVDTTEEVHLIFYVVGERSPDEAGMLEELNKLLKRDINATVEFKWLSWGDVFDKYPLIMASGEVFDGCYATNWLDFFGNVQKGAFVDITDMLEDTCPDILEMATADTWKSVTYKDRIYGIPRDGQEEFNSDGIIYREDLRKKYNVPEIKSIEDFEAYFQAIKDNEPGMKQASLDTVNDNAFSFLSFHEKSGMELFMTMSQYFGFATDPDDPEAKMVPFYEVPAYRETVELMNRWQEKGFWSTADLTNNNYANSINDSELGMGVSATWGVTAGHYYSALEFLKNNELDWEFGFYYSPSPSGHKDKTDTMEDGAAVSIRSKNPERTLMAINQMITQPEYLELLTYGVKGKHFTIDEEGYPAYPEGFTDESADYVHGVHPFGWLGYGPDLFTSPRNEANDILDEMLRISKAPTLLGFYFDGSELTTEVSAISDVFIQYEKPLRWGFVRNSIDEDIAEMKAQFEKAGIETLRTELEKQVQQYLLDNQD